jgi:hypothetical protein
MAPPDGKVHPQADPVVFEKGGLLFQGSQRQPGGKAKDWYKAARVHEWQFEETHRDFPIICRIS